ncbi:heme ABC transporter permease [Paraburkholderia acidicola]|uniref:Heme ABC transporter permease n=1 Tax=Paraburkholderia acidicola TaxID=1912599 RepID=A0A2A4EZT3_9BURK|nr:iron ABC transporter permease [Paraburkholderia acidicola]PCE25920.1 heme ABC transporter permease [Paraburkholderia acidicola]
MNTSTAASATGPSAASVPGRADSRSSAHLSAKRRRKARTTFALLSIVLVVSTVAAACIGAYRITPATIWAIVVHGGAATTGDATLDQARAVLLSIRLPRVVLALLVGAGFGAAGSALQALFRNPLADPGLIGISSGAALGAAAWIVLGPLVGLAGIVGTTGLPVAAFVGALLVAALVYRLAATRGRVALPLLLLAGIAINALAGAAIGLLTYVASDAQLRSLTFWSLGSLAGAQWPTLAVLVPFVVAAIAMIARHSYALNALQLGETEAHHLGVPTRAVKRSVLVASSLGVGALVSCTGAIGFIGLVAPHCVRLVCGPDQRVVMPAAMLLGATLTILADLAARTVAAPAEIPLGILTALLGAPFFLMLLWRSRSTLGL